MTEHCTCPHFYFYATRKPLNSQPFSHDHNGIVLATQKTNFQEEVLGAVIPGKPEETQTLLTGRGYKGFNNRMELLGFQKNQSIEEVRILSEAIDSFNGAASRFEKHYQYLEQRVKELNIELENKNKVLERNLREKEEVRNHLRNILESVATGVVVVDLKGNITTFNRAAENITGFISKKVLGNKFDKIFDLNFFKNLQFDFETLRAIQNNTEYETEIYGKRGDFAHVSLSVSHLKTSQGEKIGIVV
ncbi:MAG: PAS domain S-box protein, partial [Desulfobacteraceae bacterium]